MLAFPNNFFPPFPLVQKISRPPRVLFRSLACLSLPCLTLPLQRVPPTPTKSYPFPHHPHTTSLCLRLSFPFLTHSSPTILVRGHTLTFLLPQHQLTPLSPPYYPSLSLQRVPPSPIPALLSPLQFPLTPLGFLPPLLPFPPSLPSVPPSLTLTLQALPLPFALPCLAPTVFSGFSPATPNW